MFILLLPVVSVAEWLLSGVVFCRQSGDECRQLGVVCGVNKCEFVFSVLAVFVTICLCG